MTLSTSSLLVCALALCDFGFHPTTSLAFSLQPTAALPRFTTTSISTKSAGGYDETDGASKGLVGTLTNLINGLSMPLSANDKDAASSPSMEAPSAPTTPAELLERIRDDYVERNYLWTGDVDLATFAPDCTFQDPTIRFQGLDTFVTNVQNLRQVSDRLLGPCRSELRSIALRQSEKDDDKATSYYVETEWRMVGLLQNLPWQPCINVPGRTKFWMQPIITQQQEQEEQNAWQVYLYEEEWDMPAAKALWQLVQPSGVYPLPNEAEQPL